MIRYALLLALPLAGCPPKVEDAGGDADADADTDADTDTDTDADAQTTAVVVTVASDYSAGAFATVDLESREISDGLFVTASDASVAADDGWIFQVNRYGYDTLRAYAPGEWSQPAWEISTGEGTNPYTADLCGGSIFAVLYEADRLNVYDPATGNLAGTVDLSAYADSDGLSPEAASIVEVAGKLYVGLQRLNRDDGWISEGSAIVEVDCEDYAVTASWDVGGNAGVHPWPGQDKVLIASEAFGEEPAGIYALDPAAGAVERIADFGDFVPTSVAAWGDKAVVASHASDYSGFAVQCVDLGSGEVEILEETARFLTDAAVNDRGEAWVAASYSWLDPKLDPGIFIYDVASCAAAGSLTFALAPVSVDFY